MQLHPRDTGGSFLEIDEQVGGEDPHGPWSPAGPDWQSAIRTDVVSAITAAEIQCDDPDTVSARWTEIIEIDRAKVDGAPTIVLSNATLRFVPITDGRGEGLGGIDLATTDAGWVQAAAAGRGLAGHRRRGARRRHPLLPPLTSPHLGGIRIRAGSVSDSGTIPAQIGRAGGPRSVVGDSDRRLGGRPSRIRSTAPATATSAPSTVTSRLTAPRRSATAAPTTSARRPRRRPAPSTTPSARDAGPVNLIR